MFGSLFLKIVFKSKKKVRCVGYLSGKKGDNEKEWEKKKYNKKSIIGLH